MNIVQVNELLKRYFDAFYNVNIEELSNLFHETAYIYGHDDNGDLEVICKEDFIRILSSFPPNSKNPNFTRSDEILAIDFISEDVAVARVKLRFDNAICTDIVNLMRLNDVWRIVSVLDSKMSIMNKC